MKPSVLRDKSELFADRIVKLSKYLLSEKKEFTLSNQILRSGTSIGANIAEAALAASKKDFINKLQIAAKECAETLFWLKRLKAGGFITEISFNSIYSDNLELEKMLASSIKTLKDKQNQG